MDIEAEILSKIEELPAEKRVAFAAACAEWLYPCYSRYLAENNHGASTAIRAAIDAAQSTDTTSPDHVALRAVQNLLEMTESSTVKALRSQAESGGQEFCSLVPER